VFLSVFYQKNAIKFKTILSSNNTVLEFFAILQASFSLTKILEVLTSPAQQLSARQLKPGMNQSRSWLFRTDAANFQSVPAW